MLADRLCKTCNNQRLGVLDEQLSRCGPEAVLRRFYGIQGRSSHDIVNSHYRGSAGGSRLKMSSFDETLGMDVELEIIRGTEVRQTRQLIFKEASGAVHCLPLPDSMREPNQLRATFEKLGLKDITEAHVIYAPEESDWVEPLVKAVWPNVRFADRTVSARSYQRGVTVKIELTDRYFRAIAKMGFHYFLTQFPQYSGAEVQFAAIRQFIANDGPVSLANEFIGERQTPLLGNLFNGGHPDGWQAHILAAEIAGGVCRAHVQLFICEDFPSRPYTITLSKGPSEAVEGGHGHMYFYFENGPKGRFVGEVYELDFASTLVPPLPLKPVVGEP